MLQSVEDLTSRFPVAGLRFVPGPGGLVKAVVESPAACGAVYLHGAHVSEWQPSGQAPVLWMSEASQFAPGKPIRGGIPICFPWFGGHPTDSTSPAHGVARIREWELVTAELLPAGGVRLELRTSIEQYELRYRVDMGRVLDLTLEVRLAADAGGSMRFEEALHTYLAVGDILQVSIAGLESARFLDKVGSVQLRPATGEPVRFTGEVDRVYLDTTADCVLRDPVLQREVRVSKSRSLATVIWNPWIAKSARMPDFGDQEWPGMVCIETANVADHAVELLPGQSHVMTASLSVGELSEN